MAKKKKNFKINRDDLNVAIKDYLEKGGKITKYDCIVPERTNLAIQEREMKNSPSLVVDQQFYERVPEKT